MDLLAFSLFVAYLMIKKLPDQTLTVLSEIFNACLKIGYFPDEWKEATIKMIEKPGKDCRIAKNYRPISLIDCIAKLFERIITGRLSAFLEANNLLSNYQSGFRKGRMTSEQL